MRMLLWAVYSEVLVLRVLSCPYSLSLMINGIGRSMVPSGQKPPQTLFVLYSYSKQVVSLAMFHYHYYWSKSGIDIVIPDFIDQKRTRGGGGVALGRALA